MRMMEDLVVVPAQAQRTLNIHLSSGTGEGPTPLAAFDAALMDAGVANYNLLCLSLVIPPNATIVRAKHRTPPDDYGRRLYVVMSQTAVPMAPEEAERPRTGVMSTTPPQPPPGRRHAQRHATPRSCWLRSWRAFMGEPILSRPACLPTLIAATLQPDCCDATEEKHE